MGRFLIDIRTQMYEPLYDAIECISMEMNRNYHQMEWTIHSWVDSVL